MVKKTPKVVKPVSTRKKHALTPQMEAAKWQPGVSPNPAGRPKGSRNKFAELFVQAFMKDFEEHGEEAIERCRNEEIGVYMATATKIMPKDFNINVTQEAQLERLFDKFSSEQLRDLATGLRALGASHRQTVVEGRSREVTDQVH